LVIRWLLVIAVLMLVSRDRAPVRPASPDRVQRFHSMHFMKSQFTKAEARALRAQHPRIPSPRPSR